MKLKTYLFEQQVKADRLLDVKLPSGWGLYYGLAWMLPIEAPELLTREVKVSELNKLARITCVDEMPSDHDKNKNLAMVLNELMPTQRLVLHDRNNHGFFYGSVQELQDYINNGCYPQLNNHRVLKKEWHYFGDDDDTFRIKVDYDQEAPTQKKISEE